MAVKKPVDRLRRLAALRIDADMVDVMKKGVVIMDLNHDRSPMFPSLPEADVSSSPVDIGSGRRVCYTGAMARRAYISLSLSPRNAAVASVCERKAL